MQSDAASGRTRAAFGMLRARGVGSPMAVLKTLGMFALAYAVSVALYFVYLIFGGVLAGKSVSGGERALMAVMLLALATFAGAGMLAFVFTKESGGSLGVRIAGLAAYAGLAIATSFVEFFVSAVVFNR
jgi:hypothetical protein